MEPSLTRRDALFAAALAALATSGLSACAGGRGQSTSDGLGLVSADVVRAPGDPGAIPAVVAAIQRFGGGLYGQISGQPGNLALSPYSVAVALGMTLNGAVGATAEEMRTALALDGLGTAGLNEGLNALERSLGKLAGPVRRGDGSDAEVALAMASALFGERTVSWRQTFLDVLAGEYGAGVRTVDFLTAAERARSLINDWTSERTRDRIPELVPEGVLDAMTRLVLVNALYLKAPWETPFEKFATAPGPFRLADGSVTRVDVMHGVREGAEVGGDDGWRSVRLPYAGGGLAMTVVLPDEGRLADVESQLAREGVGALLVTGGDRGADLTLPRWTFRTPVLLGPALQALGMRLAFEPESADFTAMTGQEALFVSAVLHEVFIAVDEEGTEAAAATAVAVAGSSLPVAEPFVVDRPFLFVIHDLQNDTPLFVGRVTDPRVT
jgi:serpin B